MMAERKFCPKNLWAVILTAIRVEYRVVRAHLSELEEVRHPQGTVSEQGHTNQPGGVTAELEVEPQQRGLTVAWMLRELIEDFRSPSAICRGREV